MTINEKTHCQIMLGGWLGVSKCLTTLNAKKFGRCVKHKSNSMWSISKSTKTKYFKTCIFIDFYKYIFILNLMPATHCKHVETGATNDWESCGTLQKHLNGSFHRWPGSQVTGDGIAMGMKGASLKGSAVHKRGWGDAQHSVKHMIVWRMPLHGFRDTSESCRR